ncbi:MULTISPECIES: ABC transporter substrate-binding protein [Micrococcaceae]|uniref:ABC transporter substrate-binding protein n=1 Tax=unclassified Kocuria TaxID=2649579 RepID=UPI0010109C0F|nr:MULTISPECIES: ABC transporter substrate-binding protein [unclassified Kocuria]
MVSISRGTFLKAAAASAAALALAGCSTGSNDNKDSSSSGGSSSADADAFPVTLESSFGETTIESEPKKIVGLGWINAEIVLALGVVPIGSGYVGWGENDNHSTDWFDDKVKELGGELPTRFSETDGTNFEEIAKLSPDLIVSAVGSMDQETFDKLKEIAPVVVYNKDHKDGWMVPWQDSTRTIGKALGRSSAAEDVVKKVESKLSDEAGKYGQLKDATFVASNLSVSEAQPTISVYTEGDGRVNFLQTLGMKMSDAAKSVKAETFYGTWSNERASELSSDMLYSWVDSAESIEKIKSNDVLKQIPAVAKDAAVLDYDKKQGLGMGNTPLGIEWLLDETDFVKQIADAVTNGKK